MLDTNPTKESLLEVNNIEVIYNHVILVLKGVSLSVPKGGITALLGGNGAGKTTTLKAIRFGQTWCYSSYGGSSLL
jgi:branched-chain amino acid transport system ATP-binding protein